MKILCYNMKKVACTSDEVLNRSLLLVVLNTRSTGPDNKVPLFENKTKPLRRRTEKGKRLYE